MLLLWVILTLFFASKYNFSVIYSAYDKSNFTSIKTGELLSGQKISAKFHAKENNLGIVSVRFKTYGKINNDEIIFRIKQEDNNWYYENSYRVDQFQDNDYFTFGFPAISNSEGKTYYFEIESIRGKKGDAVSISSISPILIVQYQFTKQQLLSNKAMIPDFLINKIFFSLNDINFAMSAFSYALPLFFYTLWLFYFKKYLPPVQVKYLIVNYKIYATPSSNILFYIYAFIFIVNIFFKSKIFLFDEIVFITLWLGLIRVYRLQGNTTFFLSFASLIICSVFIILDRIASAESAAMWAYLFLIVGSIQIIHELYKNIKLVELAKAMFKKFYRSEFFRQVKAGWEKLP